MNVLQLFYVDAKRRCINISIALLNDNFKEFITYQEWTQKSDGFYSIVHVHEKRVFVIQLFNCLCSIVHLLTFPKFSSAEYI